MKRLGWWLGAAALTLAFAPGLRADVPPGPRPQSPAPSARLEQRLERLQQQAAAWASALPSGAASAAPPGSAVAHALSPQELAQKWAALLATRQERRQQQRAALQQQLGQHLSEPQVKAELALHATRLAELGRIEFLAQNTRSGEARSKLLARVAKLSTREAERHRLRLAKLLARGAAATPSAAPAAASPAPSVSAQAPKK